MGHQYNLSGKKSKLECACVGNEDFIILVVLGSGGGRCC